MRCKACDKEMKDTEIQWNPELNDWELCPTCFEIAMDAAYCDGIQAEEDDEFVVLDDSLLYGDSSDIVTYRNLYDYDD